MQIPLPKKDDRKEPSPIQTDQLGRISPFLPTAVEAILLAIYPATLVLGSLSTLFSASARAATYHAESQAYLPAEAPSYFAKKSNVFNVYFVKVGWVWITLAFFALVFTHPSFGPPLSARLTRLRRNAILRYLSITVVWIAVTQWFFGPALIDRSFLWTGGQCAIVENKEGDEAGMSDTRQALTRAACRLVGGQWRGGHDISGHVFILILGSGTLWLESLPVVLRWAELREKRRIVTGDGRIVDAGLTNDEHDAGGPTVGVQAALAVAGLSWWMLFMTAAYFHTWFEKFTGFLVASSTIYLVYFLPRGVPALRSILGMPAALV